jgi:hypothetical protein
MNRELIPFSKVERPCHKRAAIVIKTEVKVGEQGQNVDKIPR